MLEKAEEGILEVPNDSNFKIDLGFNSYCNYSDSNPGSKPDTRRDNSQLGNGLNNVFKSGDDQLSSIVVHLSKD